MDKKIESTIMGYIRTADMTKPPKKNLLQREICPRMENQMEKKMDNEMETGLYTSSYRV